MMSFKVKLSSGIGNKKSAIRDQIEHLTSIRVRNVVRNIHNMVTRNTPVWSGRAIANFQWTNGSPATTSVEPIRNPTKPGEGRRAANKVVADATRKRLRYNRKIYLTNTARYPSGMTFVDLEMGRLPNQEDSRVSPQGIMRLAFSRYPSRIVMNRSGEE